MIDENLLELIFIQHPIYYKLHHLVWSFRNCLKSQEFETFEKWVTFVKENFEDNSLLRFVESLSDDRTAFQLCVDL